MSKVILFFTLLHISESKTTMLYYTCMATCRQVIHSIMTLMIFNNFYPNYCGLHSNNINSKYTNRQLLA